MKTTAINIRHLPGVLHIVNEAQAKIFNITGHKTKLLIYGEPETVINPQQELIKSMVLNHFQLTWQQLTNKNSKRHITLARNIYLYLCITVVKSCKRQLAREIGFKNHNGVSYAVKSISNYVAIKDDAAISVHKIINQLNKTA